MARHRILHVSAIHHHEVGQLLASVGETETFEVRQVSFREFTSDGWKSLSEYAAVIFGVSDGYCGHIGPLSTGAVAALMRFVSQGGGVLWTHDTLPLNPDLFVISGFRAANGTLSVPMTVESVRLLRGDHPAMQSPFPVAGGVSVLHKGAHSTGTFSHPPKHVEVDGAQILIDHNVDPAGPHNYYLAVFSSGRGRVALLEIGHAEAENFAGWESRLFANVLHWLCSGDRGAASQADTQNQGRPPAMPRAVLGSVERFALSASLTVGTAALLLHFWDRRSVGTAVLGLVTSVVGGFIVWWVIRPRDS